MRTVFTAEGHRHDIDVNAVEHLLASHATFWLDIEAPGEDDYRLLSNTFKFHKLTIEDVENRNQRPKLDSYDDYMFAVMFVVGYDGQLVSFREHHLYISASFVVSVHQEPEPSFEKFNERIAETPQGACRTTSLLAYLVLDALVDATFDALEALDESVDRLQDEILLDATPAQLSLLQDMKHGVSETRRVLGAQRDMFQGLVTRSLQADPETTAYYRNVYDHILRQYETVDSLRDLLTGAMDVYLSTVSNRLNLTVKALTVIASLFLPLTFLTGFFGMNFAWLVGRIGSFYAFATGLALMVLTILIQLFFFRRRGWI